MYIILWCPDDMYRLQMTFLKNKYLFFVVVLPWGEALRHLVVHLFVAPRLSHPSFQPPQAQPGHEPPRRSDEKKGASQQIWAESASSGAPRKREEDARGRCVSSKRTVPRGSKKMEQINPRRLSQLSVLFIYLFFSFFFFFFCPYFPPLRNYPGWKRDDFPETLLISLNLRVWEGSGSKDAFR